MRAGDVARLCTPVLTEKRDAALKRAMSASDDQAIIEAVREAQVHERIRVEFVTAAKREAREGTREADTP